MSVEASELFDGHPFSFHYRHVSPKPVRRNVPSLFFSSILRCGFFAVLTMVTSEPGKPRKPGNLKLQKCSISLNSICTISSLFV